MSLNAMMNMPRIVVPHRSFRQVRPESGPVLMYYPQVVRLPFTGLHELSAVQSVGVTVLVVTYRLNGCAIKTPRGSPRRVSVVRLASRINPVRQWTHS